MPTGGTKRWALCWEGMRYVLPALMLVLLLAGSSGGWAQPVPTQPGARTSGPTQTEPMMGQSITHPDKRAVGTEAPSTPAPSGMRAGAGDYWYWGAPRYFRRIRGSRPREKPGAHRQT